MKLIAKLTRTLLFSFALFMLLGQAHAADKYVGTCNVVFTGDSTLHAFTGDISNIAMVVFCDTNSAGAAILNTRLEIAPKQLSTHHEKRDKNMYAMFKSDKFPKLFAIATNAPLAAAKLTPTEAAGTNGVLLVQLTFCGITKEVSARTTNQKPHTNGWEFELQTDVSLKAFQLKPSSTLFGIISVDDKVVVKAHVKVEKDTAK
jgi:polyisoprenoid-binding protein YceI